MKLRSLKDLKILLGEEVMTEAVKPKSPHGDHLIYKVNAKKSPTHFEFLGRMPYVPHHGDKGLPEWFFDNNHVAIHHQASGNLDWNSPMGPGPVWTGEKYTHSDTPETVVRRWDKWAYSVYGDEDDPYTHPTYSIGKMP